MIGVAQLLPVASSIIILIFAALVFRRYAERGGPHLIVWGIGLTLFGAGSFAEAYSATAWHPTVFRLWYLGGAVLNAAWLGQGTVYLLKGQRLPNLLVAGVLGYAVAFGVFAALAHFLTIDPRVFVFLVAGHGFVFTLVLQRRWIARWNPQVLASALMVLLVVASLIAAYMVFATPLNAAAFDVHRTLSAQYRQILPKEAMIRTLTPVFNIYGLLTLVGGALYSAWLLWRKEIAPHRVVGNLLIAIGALSLAFASILVRFGLGDYLYMAEFAAALLMFAGFAAATVKMPVTREVQKEMVVS